ncbi:MAG: class I adenylate-forming enzyme family protein [Reyranellaceae bacterium]
MNPFVNLTYGQSIALLGELYGERNALAFGARRWSFRQIKPEVDRAAARLASLGLQKQDKVAIWMPNRPEAIWYWLGAAQMGCVTVFLNTRLTQDEIAYQVKQSDSRVLLLQGPDGFRDYLKDFAALCPELAASPPGEWRSQAFPELRHVASFDRPDPAVRGALDWSQPAPADLPVPAPETDPDAAALIVYSSGTTALPKGVVLAHHVWRKGWDHGPRFDQTADDRLWLCMPLFGILSNVNGVVTFWARGSSVVLEERFEPRAALQRLQDERCTTIYMMPIMMEKMLAQPDFAAFDLSRLRTGTIVSNDPDVLARAINVFGAKELYSTYGMSETSSVIVRGLASDPLELKQQCHGKPMPDIEVRIADPDTNRPLPAGQQGEIQVRGYSVMKGYYKKPAETAAAFTGDGWLKTGDAGVEREDGNFRFISRLKDGYKYNGFNVSTPEVEAALRRHDAIANAAVVGIPDPTAGEIGIAFVVAHEGKRIDTQEVGEFLKSVLAQYKRPQRIVVLDELPLTAGTGKVQTRQLKEMARQIVDKEKARMPA